MWTIRRWKWQRVGLAGGATTAREDTAPLRGSWLPEDEARGCVGARAMAAGAAGGKGVGGGGMLACCQQRSG